MQYDEVRLQLASRQPCSLDVFPLLTDDWQKSWNRPYWFAWEPQWYNRVTVSNDLIKRKQYWPSDTTETRTWSTTVVQIALVLELPQHIPYSCGIHYRVLRIQNAGFHWAGQCNTRTAFAYTVDKRCRKTLGFHGELVKSGCETVNENTIALCEYLGRLAVVRYNFAIGPWTRSEHQVVKNS